jgi:plastocyanin
MRLLIPVFILILIPLVAVSQTNQSTTVSIINGAHIQSNAPGFSPQNITVVLGINNTVKWVNMDSFTHTVTSRDGLFDTTLNAGNSTTYTFTKAGVYGYYCRIHSWMVGFVIVKQAQTTQTVFSPYVIVLIAVIVLVISGISYYFVSKRRKP